MSSNLTQQLKSQFELNNSSGTIAQLQEEINRLRTDVKYLQSQNASLQQIVAAYQCKFADTGNGGLDNVQIVMPEGQRQTDDGDLMNEDMDILTECLNMIKKQKTEILQLKKIILSEKAFLEHAEILAGKKKTQSNADIREEAAGSSFHQFAEETPVSRIPMNTATFAVNQLMKPHSTPSSQQSMLEHNNIVVNNGVKVVGTRIPGVNQPLKPNGNENVQNVLTRGANDSVIKRQSASNINKIAYVNSQNSEKDRDLNVTKNMIFTGNANAEFRNVVNQKPYSNRISPGRTVLEKEAPIYGNSATAQVHQLQMLNPNLSNIGLSPNLHYGENRPSSSKTSEKRPPSSQTSENRPSSSQTSQNRLLSSQTINKTTRSELTGIAEPTDDVANSRHVQPPKEIFTRSKQDEPVNNTMYENCAHPQLLDSRNNDTEKKNATKFGCFASNTDVRNNTESELTISQMDLSANQPNLIGAQPVQEQSVYENLSALKICPVCNLEFSHMSMTNFQQHVCECFEQCDEPPETLLAVDDDRICPMCQAAFPLAIPHETYEQHVLGHFNDANV